MCKFSGLWSHLAISRIRSLVFVFLTFVPLGVVAQEDWNDEVSGLGGALSNANLPTNPYRSAVPVTVIDRRMIDASGAQSLGEILRIVPGLVTGHRFGHSLSLGSHGNADEYMRRTNVIIDGRSLFTPVVGGLISFNVPVSLDDIERIEVYRGPAGSEFGSNAMVNTVRIYTASAMEKQGTRLKASSANSGQKNGHINHGFTLGNMFFTTSYSQSEDSGLHNREDSMRREQVFVRGDIAIDESNELALSFGVSKQDIDVWVTSNPNSDDHNANDESAFINSTWVHSFESGTVVTNFSNTYLKRESEYLTAPVNNFIGRLLNETGYSFNSTAIDSKVSKYFSEGVEVSVGGKFSHDIVDSDSLFQKDRYTLDSSAIFGKIVWDIFDSTALHLGSMFEKTDVVSESAQSYNASIFQTINQNNKIRVGYNKGTRLPWTYEAYGARKFTLYDRGNVPYYDSYATDPENLENEEVVQRDISWLYRNSGLNLNTEVRYYQDNYKSLIANHDVPPPPGINASGPTIISSKSFDNPSKVSGVELSADWRPQPEWMIVASASYMDVDSNLNEADYDGNTGETGPSTTLSVLADRKFFEYWRVGGMFTRISSYKWSNGWDIEAQKVFDAYVQRCFGDLGAKGFCAKVAGTDLFGGQPDFRPESYRERSYRLEATLEF